MKRTDFVMLALLPFALSCRSGQPAVENRNVFFDPYPEIEDLVEADIDAMPRRMAVDVDLGGGLGEASLVLKKHRNGIVPYVIYNGIRHDISRECAVNTADFMAALAALDLDGDGRKEILFHNGDIFSLNLFSVKGERGQMLERLGTLLNNSGFFVTDDGVIVSRMGSQGGAEMARIQDGKMVKLEEDWIDKLLFSSKGFHNLEYIFDDNSSECRSHEPLLKTGRYIICDRSDIQGDHAMDIDLDGDGTMEQFYMGNPGWGATHFDIIRVNTRRKSHTMPQAIYKDTIVFRESDMDLLIKDCIQLSAVDTDRDGLLEVIATAGTPERTSTYVMKYGADSLTLLKHFIKEGVVLECDLKD